MSENSSSLPTIQMLWVEGRLSRLERLSMASFIANGHPVDLYTYGLDNDPPQGVRLLDAATILPESMRFRDKAAVGHGSLATFSNLFRFTLLYEHGGIWCDADTVCLKPLIFADDMPMFFSSEHVMEQSEGKSRVAAKTNNGAIKIPPKHPLMAKCLEKYNQIDLQKKQWGEAGPGVIRSAVEELGLTQFVLRPEVFCPIPQWETTSLLFGARTITPSAFAIHFWNEILRWNFFNKDESYDLHSVYERLCRHYLREEHGS
jgi:hypothetical protein